MPYRAHVMPKKEEEEEEGKELLMEQKHSREEVERIYSGAAIERIGIFSIGRDHNHKEQKSIKVEEDQELKQEEEEEIKNEVMNNEHDERCQHRVYQQDVSIILFCRIT